MCIKHHGKEKVEKSFEAAVNAVRDRDQTSTTATVHKPTQQMKCGIGMKLQNGSVTITTINSNGLFANSDLEVGMVVKTINNVSVIGKTAAEATQLIKDAAGQVTIVAIGSRSTDLDTPPFQTYKGTFDMSYVDRGNHCRGNVTLELQQGRVNGRFGYRVLGTKSDVDGTAFITEGFVTYGGEAWWVDEVRSGNDTGLKVLMTGKFDWSTDSFEGTWRASTGISGRFSSFQSANVTKTFAPSITTTTVANTTPAATAPAMSAVVATPVNQSYSQTPIVTAVAESSSPVIVAKANKVRKDMTVGIGIKAPNPNGTPVISSIQPDSPFAKTALRVGMDVQSINYQSMSGKTAGEATQIIRDAVGEITVVAGWNLSVSSFIPAVPIPSAPPAETREPEIYVPSYR